MNRSALLSSMFAKSLESVDLSLLVDEEVTDVATWFQVWPDTSCGHGGVAGRALTTGVVVAVTTNKDCAFFCSQGRLLCFLKKGPRTAKVLADRRLPGRGEPWPDAA